VTTTLRHATAAATFLVSWLAIAGCNNESPERECFVGHFGGSWGAPVSYVGTASSAPDGLAGSASLLVTVADTACDEPDGSFDESLTFTLAPTCVLTGTRTSTHSVQSCSWNGHVENCIAIFVDGTAAMGDPNGSSTCELPLDGASMSLVVQQGTAHVTAKGALDIDLSGPLTRWSGAAETAAFVTVHFSSASPSS
jgi:hypothetical protein